MKLTNREVIRIVSETVHPFMQCHGYLPLSSPTSGLFAKPADGMEKRIAIVANRPGRNREFRLDHYCHYRLPMHTGIHNKYLPYRTPREKKEAPTISHYYVNLIPSTEFVAVLDALSFHELDGLEDAVSSFQFICEKFSFPFLDRFQSVQEIISGFQGGRERWPVQDPIGRFQLILLDAVVHRDQPRFAHWKDEAMRFCESRIDGPATNLVQLASSLEREMAQISNP